MLTFRAPFYHVQLLYYAESVQCRVQSHDHTRHTCRATVCLLSRLRMATGLKVDDDARWANTPRVTSRTCPGSPYQPSSYATPCLVRDLVFEQKKGGRTKSIDSNTHKHTGDTICCEFMFLLGDTRLCRCFDTRIYLICTLCTHLSIHKRMYMRIYAYGYVNADRRRRRRRHARCWAVVVVVVVVRRCVQGGSESRKYMHRFACRLV